MPPTDRGEKGQVRQIATLFQPQKHFLRGQASSGELIAAHQTCCRLLALAKIETSNQRSDMKYLIPAALLSVAAIGLFAQGQFGSQSSRRFESPYDPKSRPPVSLSEAYPLACAYLGNVTNRFYCVSATCLEVGKSGFPAWKFSWSATNGESAYLEVTFDKEVYLDPRTQMLLRNK